MDYKLRDVDFDPFAGAPADTAALPPPEEPASQLQAPPAPRRIPGVDVVPAAEPPAPPPGYQLRDVDFDPFNQPAKYNPADDTAIVRGAKAAFSTAVDAPRVVLDINRIAALPNEQRAAEMLKQQPVDPSRATMQVPGVEDIGSKNGYLQDALTFAGESIGQMIGSVGGAMVQGGTPAAGVGAVIGGGVGATALGVGALPGAVAGSIAGFASGSAGHFVAQGVAGTYQDLMSDEGVRKGLADGTVDPETVLQFAVGGGSLIGMIDIIPQAKLAGRLGLKKVSKDVAKTTILKAARRGLLRQGAEEGGTEALQGAISEFGQAALGGDVNAGQRALSVLNQGLAGAFGGAGPGTVGGVVENARIPSQPGVNTPAPNATIGQPTPGGTGVAAPPPAGASVSTPGQAQTPPSAAKPGVAKLKPGPAPTVVAPGQVDPSIASVIAPTPEATAPEATAPVVATAAGTPSPVAPSPVDNPIVASAPVVEDEEDLYDPADELDDDEDPDLAAIKETQNAIKDMLKAREAAAAVTPPATPNADITAALTQVPPSAPAVAQVAPPVSGPEPIGTAGAAARRAAPQPPLEGAPTAPVARSAPVSPEPIISPQEPVGAVSPQLGVPVQPGPAIAPAPAPVPAAPQMDPVARQLSETLRQEFFSDPLGEDPDFQRVADMVATEVAAAQHRGISPAEFVRTRLPAAKARVRDEVIQSFLNRQQAAVDQATAQQEKAVVENAKRQRVGAVKGKSALATKVEKPRTTLEQATEEMKKPEAERDAGLVEIAGLAEQRKKIAKRGELAKRQRATLTTMIEEAQARRVAKIAEVEKAAAPPVEEVKPGLTEEEAQTAAEATDAAKAAMRIAKAKERGKKLDPVVKSAVNAVPTPNWDRMTMAKMATEGKRYMRDVIDAVNEALQVSGEKLNTRIDRAHSMAENLAIFGKEVLAGKHEGFGPTEFAMAKAFVDAGATDEFFNLATKEDMRGGMSQAEVPQEGQGGVYEEGSNQFLDAPPDPGVLDFEGVDGSRRSISAIRQSTGAEVLRDAIAGARREIGLKGFARLIQKMHAKMLRQMVGDIPVVFASPADIRRIRGQDTIAFFRSPSNMERFTGTRPAIYINNDKWVEGGQAWRAHIIAHEMTHAATVFAIGNNVRGTKQIVEKLRMRLRQDLVATHNIGGIYGLKDDFEFVAEAFSNPQFQDLLSSIDLPAALEEELQGIMEGQKKPTWWRAFVATVQNALGMFDFLSNNQRTTTYLDAIIAAHPAMMQSMQEQDAAAGKLLAGPSRNKQMADRLHAKRKQAYARHAFDILPMSFDVLDSYDAVKGKAGFRWYNKAGRALAVRLGTTMELIRSSEALFGGANNPFQQLAEAYLSGRSERDKVRKVGDDITVDLAAYKKASPIEFEEFTNVAHEATLNQIDPTAPLSAPSNKHVSAKGNLDNHRRAAHAVLAPRWDALSAEGKSLWTRMANHYAAQEELRLRKVVRNILNAASGKFGVQLPAGETVQSVVDWVMSGEIDRIASEDPKNPKLGEREPRDIALHAALKKTAETLAGTRGLRKIRGTYVPLTRWGKYFFTATHKVDVPAGAVLDPGAKGKNVLIFGNKKDLNAYTSAQGRDPEGEQIDRVQSVYVDPATGERVTSKDASAVQVFKVTVQNRTLLMEDDQAKLAVVRDQYVKDGYDTVSEVAIIDSIMHGDKTILPSQLNRLIKNIQQSNTGSVTVGQQANINAVTDAYIRQLSGSRAAHRRLKRRNVAGFSKDLIKATLSANHVMAGHLTQLDRAPHMAELEKELDDFVNAGRKGEYSSSPTGTDTLRRQAYVGELRRRMASVTQRNTDSGGERLANVGMDLSFLTHLFSPAYTIINLMQTMSTTYPVLSARFGDGATTRELTGAFYDLGAGRTVLRGIKETVHETRKVFSPAHKQFRHHDHIRALAGKMPDGALFQQTMDELERLGLGASAGIETADVHELGQGRFTRGLDRVVRIARALPEAAEAVNRYSTALAAMRLAKRKGMSDPAAIKFAATTVEMTQGGYAAENNPAFMSNKWLRLPLQFKKYPLMYGQLFYGNLVRAINPVNDPETRKVAAKTVVRLSAMTVALAGTAGLPFMEIARGLLLAVSAAGFNDDDWESWENELQAWYAGAIEWATGSKELGAGGAEVLARGASRMLGFDTSSRLGNDSMVMFGDPKSLDEQGVYAWLFEQIIGAPGGMATDVIKGIHNRDITKAIPLPKFMRDTMKGYNQFMEGTKTEAGREVAPPIGGMEAIWQGLGFRPASSARQWETGGSGAQSKRDKFVMSERTKTMGSWANAPARERQKIFRDQIRSWNKAHPSKKERIDYSDLQKSLARRKALAKQN